MEMLVAGLGQCSLDLIAFVDGYPPEDTKREVHDFVVQGGGPVATALVGLSRLGVRTSLMGVVSDDEAGAAIRKGLREEGVDTKGLLVRKGGFSQRAFIVVNRKTGSRTILWKRPMVYELAPEEVRTTTIKKSSFLLVDGLMPEATLRAAKTAKEHNVPVMLDAGRMRPGMLGLARLSDYIVGSEDFSKTISTNPAGTIKKLRAFNPKAITITLGRNGSITWHGGAIFRQSAFRVSAVDTTGAGDVFHGGYIYGLLQGWDIRKTVRFASAFAALKCLKPGGRTGIPTLAETMRFISGGNFP